MFLELGGIEINLNQTDFPEPISITATKASSPVAKSVSRRSESNRNFNHRPHPVLAAASRFKSPILHGLNRSIIENRKTGAALKSDFFRKTVGIDGDHEHYKTFNFFTESNRGIKWFRGLSVARRSPRTSTGSNLSSFRNGVRSLSSG